MLGRLFCALLLALLLAAGQAAAKERVTYCGFQSTCRDQELWLSRRVALVTLPERGYDAQVLRRMVEDYNRAWEAYERLTGFSPLPKEAQLIHGRATIAQSADADCCAAARGTIGKTGIEIYGGHFDRIYRLYRDQGLHDHIVFHEMGRNFWRLRPQLGAIKSLETGFAIANKFLVMEQAGLAGGPFRKLSFSEFRRQSTEGVLRVYLEQPRLDWRGALLDKRLPAMPEGWGAADLAAAFFLQLFQAGGPHRYRAFFAEVARQRATNEPIAAARLFLGAANAATGRDFRWLFRDPDL